MDIFGTFLLLAIILSVGFIMYAANTAQAAHLETTPLLTMLLRWLIGLNALIAVNVLLVGVLPADMYRAETDLRIGLEVAIAYVFLAAAASVGAWRFMHQAGWRARLRAALPRSASYDPASPVHTTAVVLIVMMVAFTVGQFILSGGISGLAETLQNAGVSLGDIAFNQALWLLAAALGVGAWIRRPAGLTVARLGLAKPSAQAIVIGAGVGLGLAMLTVVFSIVWVALATPEQFAEQNAASEALASSIDSLPLAFALSALVAFGEEIFFRGAIQPVFGNVFTSVFFILLHTQYTLSPATVMLLVASLTLGWLRQRWDTSAAIAGHFTYNFAQLALAVLAAGAV